MRSLIQGGWVVGYDGRGHELIPNGSVVFEADRIIHVGRDFAGTVDRTIDARGKLVSPGFINCHLHATVNAAQTVFISDGKLDYFGSNFIGYAAPRRGAPRPSTIANPTLGGTYGMWSALRGGSTTILDVGTMPGGPDTFTKLVGELGVRAYLGPGFRSAEYRFDGDRICWEWNEANGTVGLARAIDYVKKYDGAYDGRIRAMIYPGQMDTCTLDLLRAARQAADDLGVPIQVHAAMNQREFHKILEQHGKTPIALLHSIGFLKPKTGLGHCVFHNQHSWCHYPYGDDLKMLGDFGATVVHAPYKYAKMGITFESFARYRSAGINIAIGTDTYPQDMVHEMRWAALMSRMAEQSFTVGKPRDVFDAATLGGAAHLGRDDIGRLAVGAKADIVVVDLLQVHYGAVHDPIKALVECGSGRDVETIFVDGQILVEHGKAVRFDEAAMLRDGPGGRRADVAGYSRLALERQERGRDRASELSRAPVTGWAMAKRHTSTVYIRKRRVEELAQEDVMDLANQLTNEIHQTLEQTEALARLQKLAAEREIRPLDFDTIMSKADFWPEDESADDFIRAVEEWRRDKRSRDLP